MPFSTRPYPIHPISTPYYKLAVFLSLLTSCIEPKTSGCSLDSCPDVLSTEPRYKCLQTQPTFEKHSLQAPHTFKAGFH